MDNANPSPETVTRDDRKTAQAMADRARARKARLGRIARTLGIVVVVLAVMAGLVWIAKGQDAATQPSPIDNTVSAQDHVRGNPEAAVTVVEYGDFECPACAAYAPVADQLFDEYGDRVQFVFRHFPLKTIHPNAVAGARAAEAASKQGKFWEMFDQLYSDQSHWVNLNNPTSQFATYAQSLGLDVDQFKADMDSKEVKDRVEADYISANAAGLNGTPTFYLNGQPIENPRSYEAFSSLLKTALGE